MAVAPLTDRQTRFVELYVSGPRGVAHNATRAAEAAGYAWPAKQGPRLMTFPGVAAVMRARVDAQCARIRAEWRARLRAEYGLPRRRGGS